MEEIIKEILLEPFVLRYPDVLHFTNEMTIQDFAEYKAKEIHQAYLDNGWREVDEEAEIPSPDPNSYDGELDAICETKESAYKANFKKVVE